MFKVLTKGCEPTKGSKYSACVDVVASEDVVIGAGETKLVKLGIALDIDPRRGRIYELEEFFHYKYGSIVKMDEYEDKVNKFKSSHYLQLMLRSSLGKAGLIMPSGVGIIDLDYKNEIKMIIHNPVVNIDTVIYEKPLTRCFDIKNFPLGVCEIKKGDRIGQITLLEHKAYLFGIETDEERKGGFGSTGIN